MKNIENKRWEEIFLMSFKQKKSKLNELQKSFDEILENFTSDCFLDEVEEYVQNIDNKIHIPTWNKFPQTCPESLNTATIDGKYLVFSEPDFVSEAYWKDGAFYTYNAHRESGNFYEKDNDITYWLPVTYPTPY